MSKTSVLVLDDQQHVLDAITLLLEAEGFQVASLQAPAQILASLQQQPADLVLMDMNFSMDTTSGQEGLALVAKIRANYPMLPIVVMTAWASIELTVQAMQQGADDFVEKPWNNRRLINLLNNQLNLYREKRQNRNLTELINQPGAQEEFIGGSKAMQQAMALIARTAQSDANILLTGESGVGKSMIASFIHNKSLRKHYPFVSVNMGALTDTLFASEIFGHLKGAFTDAKTQRIGRFELAENGTLFMDEIANIPLELQAKLLRVLESGEFEALGSSRTQKANVRIISATNENLLERVGAGHFRQDLMYRLNTITIEIPPLRQRPEDIPLLAEHFLRRFCLKYRRELIALSNAAMERMQSAHWPGNVRELAHCIERAVLVCADPQISPQDLGLLPHHGAQSFEDMTLEAVEKQLIFKALTRNNNNVAISAEQLGLSRNALYRRLEKFKIDISSLTEQD